MKDFEISVDSQLPEKYKELLTPFSEMALLMDETYMGNSLNYDVDPNYNKLLPKFEEIQLKEFKEKGLSMKDNPVAWEGHKNAAHRECVKYLSKRYLSLNLRCPRELREIRRLYDVFASKYDLNDPRAYLIFRALVSAMLSTYRFERYSAEKGSLITEYDKNDIPRTIVNPAEEMKRRYMETTLNAISKLDQIFEGIKISNHTVIDIKELFTSTKTIDGEFDEIPLPHVEASQNDQK